MRYERNLLRRTLAAAMTLAWLLSPALAAADEEKKPEEKKTEKAPAAKPKVFTNADLERYANSGSGKVTGGAYTHEKSGAAPAPEPLPGLPAAAPTAAVEPEAFPEDRPESATLPELEERLTTLQAERDYLHAKERWMRNPLLPAPTPPPGEELLDPSMPGGDQYRDTQRRLQAVENRLNKVRALLSAAGATP